MANPQNLRTPTTSEARERGKLGGIKSGEARREKKKFEAFQITASNVLNDGDFQEHSLKSLAKKANDILNNPKSSATEVKLAMDIIQFLRDSSGQKPSDKQELTGNMNIAPSTFNILPVKGKDEL